MLPWRVAVQAILLCPPLSLCRFSPPCWYPEIHRSLVESLFELDPVGRVTVPPVKPACVLVSGHGVE